MHTHNNKTKSQFNIVRWLIWGILVTAYAINFFHALSMGVVKNSIMTEFSLSESMFVSIANTYSILYLLMQIPTGILVDTLGARITASVGTLLSAIGIITFSLTNEIAFLFIGRSLVGLGTSVIYVSILKIQSKWFEEEKFGTMTGITCFIGTLGGALAQAPLAFATSVLGWRKTFIFIGILSFAIAFLIFMVVRNSPSEKGYTELNATSKTVIPTKKELSLAIVSIFKNPYTWPPFLSYAAFYGSFVILMGYWGTTFISLTFGISEIMASNFTTLGVVGSAIGAIIIGNLSDKHKTRRKPAFFTGILYSFSWFILIFFAKHLALYQMAVLMFVNGFLSYAYVVSWPAVKEVNNPKYVGISTSVANIGGFMGSICLPIIVGFSFDNLSGKMAQETIYTVGFGIVLAFVILGTIISYFIKETHCVNIYEGDID